MSMTAQGDPMLKKRNQKTKRLEFLHREESSEEKLSTDTLSLYSNDRWVMNGFVPVIRLVLVIISAILPWFYG